MRIQNWHFRGKLKTIKSKLPASTSSRVLLAFIILAFTLFLFYYLSGIILIVAAIVLGALIYGNTESHVTDHNSIVFDDDDEPRGDGYRDGPEGYGYYSGGVRDDD